MSTGEESGPVHPVPTCRSGYRYLFYDEHHGGGSSSDARWLPSLSHDEEFSVFDTADGHELFDERHWYYGVLLGPNREIRQLGTRRQQVAEFPAARPGEPWHGYPLWPLKDAGPENRRGEKFRPPKDVFLKMEAAGLITRRDRKRLMKGDHVRGDHE